MALWSVDEMRLVAPPCAKSPSFVFRMCTCNIPPSPVCCLIIIHRACW